MSSEDEEEAAGGIAATLGAWRERGAHRLDPVRFHFIETLARRAADYSGDARRILDEKLAALLAAYGEELERAPAAESAEAKQPSGSALKPLVERIAQQASLRGSEASAPTLDKTLDHLRTLWSRLSAERRLTQSLAKLPQNAGPLNSHNLVHQSLTLMRELSPEYLARFVSYVDTLLWLDQAHAPVEAPRAESGKKPARGKPA